MGHWLAAVANLQQLYPKVALQDIILSRHKNACLHAAIGHFI